MAVARRWLARFCRHNGGLRRTRCHPPTGGSGFTLLELLTSVVVIGVLASLITVGLSRAKGKAKGVQCLSNQRQVNFGYQLRLQDQPGSRLDGPEVLDWQVQEIGRNELGWICPVAPALVESPWINSGNRLRGKVQAAWQDPGWLQDGGEQPLFGPNLRAGSYAANDHLFAGPRYNRWPRWFEGGLDPHLFTVETQITHPQWTPVLGDGVEPYVLAHVTDFRPADLSGQYSSGVGLLAIPRHGNPPTSVPRSWPASAPLPGAVNLAFFDGHSELAKLDRLWEFYWHKDYGPSPARRRR